MIKHNFFTLLVALCATTALWASNTITYTATEKLTKYTLEIGEPTFGFAITSHTFSNGTGTIICDGEITIIGEGAFSECSGLTSVTIPNSVTKIEQEAFFSCSNLTAITIPNSVTAIGNRVFAGHSGLTSIDVDATSTHFASIDGVLFNYTKDTLIQYPASNSRTEYTIPNSVTAIGDMAFFDCDSLTSITIPNSVTTIGNWVFQDCYGLISVTIPNSVMEIGEQAFNYCHSLTSITIPNSVTSIRRATFFGCSALTSVTISNSVTTIGKMAFYDCFCLAFITCEAITPPTCEDDCFYHVDKAIPLYVPAGSVMAYKAADEWKEFTDIRPISTAVDNINADVNTNKFMRNGQVLIQKNDKTFTILGQEVR